MASIHVEDHSREAIDAKNAAILRFLTEAGLHLEGEAKEELENTPRRVDTGNLKNSIANQVVQDEDAVYVGTNVEYAVYVHEGTVRMAPNRFLKNAFERNAGQLKDKMKEALEGK